MGEDSQASTEHLEKIHQEWMKFRNGEEVDHSIVRDFIYRSWTRCRDYRVDPVNPRLLAVPDDEFEQCKRDNVILLDSSRPIMERIFSRISSVGSTMSLTSPDGIVLLFFPSDSMRMNEGWCSREEFIGTAGSSTCLVERRQIEIAGAEHYCAASHDLVCSAAPIFSKKGDFLGVLSTSTRLENFHPYTGAMLETAVYAISEQVELRSAFDEQRELLEMMDDGVITFDYDMKIHLINSKAMSMVRLSNEACGKNLLDVLSFSDTVRNLMSSFISFRELDTRINTRSTMESIPCIISLKCGAKSDTFMLTMREAARMREFALSVTGTQAKYGFEDILGKSDAITEAVRNAVKIASTDTTVLILGESGTGKELFAQALHNASPRKNNPFIVVNCGALPRDLIQSELFGYSEGAFTGASRQGKPGKFELADTGTIFLDEIGEMPLDVQVNLLRLLQNREVVRIGGKRTMTVDIRIIAATNKDLYRMVENGSFREDLYYRLNVFPLHIPPLRDRKSDILPLAGHFLDFFSKKAGKTAPVLSREAAEALSSYRWPGNIRELENCMERVAYMVSGNVVRLHDINEIMVGESTESGGMPGANDQPKASGTGRAKIWNEEHQAIVDALEKNAGSIEKTIAELGMRRSTLYYKIKKYGITPSDYRPSAGRRNHGADAPSSNSVEGLSADQLRLLVKLAKAFSND